MIRPAAAFRHKGMDPLLAIVESGTGRMGLPMLAKQLKVDTSQQGFLKFRLPGYRVGDRRRRLRSLVPRNPANKQRPPTGAENKPMHRIASATPAVRMVAPFDWLAFLRQWRFDCEEVRVKGRAYYKITGEFKRISGVEPVLLPARRPDDRLRRGRRDPQDRQRRRSRTAGLPPRKGVGAGEPRARRHRGQESGRFIHEALRPGPAG